MEMQVQVSQQQNLWQRFLLQPAAVQSIVITCIVAALSVVTLFVAIVRQPPRIAPPPFSYVPDRLQADPYEVCPGERLRYRLFGTTNNAERRRVTIYGVIMTPEREPVERGTMDQAVLVTTGGEGAPFGPMNFSPPAPLPPLPPGEYIYEHNADVNGASVTSAYISFAVPEDCE